MDKQVSSISGYNHGISLLERKNLVITGVKKIENFDNNQFILETIMGFMVIKGEGLELIKLDTLQGNVSIKGLVNSISYVEENSKKEKEDSIFNRLFRWYWKYKFTLCCFLFFMGLLYVYCFFF